MIGALGQPPEWLVEQHGIVWEFYAFHSEPRVAAFRRVRLPTNRVGSRCEIAGSWPELGRLLDSATEFDRLAEARIASSREWLAAKRSELVPA